MSRIATSWEVVLFGIGDDSLEEWEAVASGFVGGSVDVDAIGDLRLDISAGSGRCWGSKKYGCPSLALPCMMLEFLPYWWTRE